jgi:hypothetical protein
MDLTGVPASKAKLAKLRPTQMTLGFEEVARKRKEWRELDLRAKRSFLRAHRFPAVRGPGGHLYILDHHHLGRALVEEKVVSATTARVADLAHLEKREFWTAMALKGWTHPFDGRGRLRPFKDLPKRLCDMTDDPYRSLAFEVRRAGGYPKETTPYAEFLWADFFRRRIPRKILRRDPDAAVKRGVKLARGRDASHLPDWVGGENRK